MATEVVLRLRNVREKLGVQVSEVTLKDIEESLGGNWGQVLMHRKVYHILPDDQLVPNLDITEEEWETIVQAIEERGRVPNFKADHNIRAARKVGADIAMQDGLERVQRYLNEPIEVHNFIRKWTRTYTREALSKRHFNLPEIKAKKLGVDPNDKTKMAQITYNCIPHSQYERCRDSERYVLKHFHRVCEETGQTNISGR